MSTKVSIEEVLAQVAALTERVAALEESSKKPANKSDREMTDDDARRIMKGDLKDEKHGEAAKKLGLSYGQVYSCRLGYTFKNIHKEMKEAGETNQWIK